ncbi:Cupredoxin [Lentinula raphanica]|uniref:Cupredoxin n=1 Tax=Lentinula raphanica TaxID=153919 RepID=A0AA38UB02_9AGAR|nr:Cupredoxin [Lentinula raphanica]KAJ3836067.1 Cupredoxin [Lentinula raphanica]KAJ3968353.1 Cupredoxin [Lentinula raphanica]
MFFSKTSALAALAGISLVAIPPVVRSATIDVTVGGPNGTVAYSPEYVNASIGDVVRFTFQQKNHTVTQSSFASPCSPLASGFDSGFVPVADNVTSDFITAELTIENTDPVWVYCRQTGHCEQGMVFAVNPGSDAKFAAFQAAAMGLNSTTTAAASVVTVTATVTVSGGETITTTYGSYPGSSAPTSAVSTDHRVIVGDNGTLTYNPANITAQIGDTVTFEFHQKNHTVTQSSFANPCTPLSASSPGTVSFDSGFMAVSANATTFPTVTIQINDTKPFWAYCRQTTPVSHCESGMVFSVNAVENSNSSFEAFQAKAIALNTTSASGSASLSSPSATSNTNGALSIHNLGAGILIAVFSAAVGAFL